MPEKKKAPKLPPGASPELNESDCTKKQWTEEADQLAKRLARGEWHAFSSRPRGESTGYYVVLHWYVKEKVWVPIFMQHGNIGSQLTKIFNNKLATPICKYLSSFPRSQRKLLWVKWVQDSLLGKENSVEFREVIRAFSAKYNQGEMLAFNMEEESDVPENFSLLDFK